MTLCRCYILCKYRLMLVKVSTGKSYGEPLRARKLKTKYVTIISSTISLEPRINECTRVKCNAEGQHSWLDHEAHLSTSSACRISKLLSIKYSLTAVWTRVSFVGSFNVSFQSFSSPLVAVSAITYHFTRLFTVIRLISFNLVLQSNFDRLILSVDRWIIVAWDLSASHLLKRHCLFISNMIAPHIGLMRPSR